MKKLGKKVSTTLETVEAYACICSCYCSTCYGTYNYYNNVNSANRTRTNSMS